MKAIKIVLLNLMIIFMFYSSCMAAWPISITSFRSFWPDPDIDTYDVYMAANSTQLRHNYENGIKYIADHDEGAFCISFDAEQQAGVVLLIVYKRDSWIWPESWDHAVAEDRINYFLVANIFENWNNRDTHGKKYNEIGVDMYDYNAFLQEYAMHAYQPGHVPTAGLSCGDPGYVGHDIPPVIVWANLHKDGKFQIDYYDFVKFISRINSSFFNHLE